MMDAGYVLAAFCVWERGVFGGGDGEFWGIEIDGAR